MSPDLTSAALTWAQRGWSVFPCQANKRPATAHGFHDATTDPAQIKAWQWPMIGAVPASAGLVVLDIDVKAGASLADVPGDGLDTRRHRTQSGGWHLIYKARPGAVYGNGPRPDIAAGVDVRHADGYVILPPSPGYRLEHDVEPDDAPAWLESPKPSSLDVLGGNESRGLDDRETIPTGEQESAIHARAFHIARIRPRPSESEAVAMLWQYITDRCPNAPGREPWERRHAIEKIRRAYAAPIEYPISVADGNAEKREPLELRSLVGVERKVAVIYPGALNIPVGTIAILTGQQGTGKGLLEVAEIAKVSQEHGVLVASDEDSIEHTILPRLVAAGAKIENVRMVQSLKLPDDTDGLIARCREHNVALVVVDPWTNHVGDIDVNKGPELREALMALKAACDAAGFVALLTAHPNKNSQNPDPLERVAHSQALTQVARSAFWIVLDPEHRKGDAGAFAADDYPPRIVAQVKANLTGFAHSRKYQLKTRTLTEPMQSVAYLDFLCESDHDWLTLHKLARERDQARIRESVAPEQSSMWDRLRAYLESVGGTAKRSEVMAALGIERGSAEERTLTRAVDHAHKVGDLAPPSGRGVYALVDSS